MSESSVTAPTTPATCEACGMRLDAIPEGWNSEAMRHALHLIDERDAKLAQREAELSEVRRRLDNAIECWDLGNHEPEDTGRVLRRIREALTPRGGEPAAGLPGGPVTDLVAELRKRAENAEYEEGHSEPYNVGRQSGLKEAADLVEADPLYKASGGDGP